MSAYQNLKMYYIITCCCIFDTDIPYIFLFLLIHWASTQYYMWGTIIITFFSYFFDKMLLNFKFDNCDFCGRNF